MQYFIIETIGWIGSILVLGVYYLNIQHKIPASSPIYIWGNIIGGLCLIINTIYHHAFPSAVLNAIWALIAVVSLVKANTKKAKR